MLEKVGLEHWQTGLCVGRLALFENCCRSDATIRSMTPAMSPVGLTAVNRPRVATGAGPNRGLPGRNRSGEDAMGMQLISPRRHTNST